MTYAQSPTPHPCVASFPYPPQAPAPRSRSGGRSAGGDTTTASASAAASSSNGDAGPPGGLALAYRSFARFTSLIGGADSVKPKVRPIAWVMRHVEEIFDSRYSKDTAELRGEAEPDGAATPFPTFVVEFFSKRYGLRSLIDQTCWDLIASVDVLRRQHLEVETFARFLEEAFDPDDLLFFLYVRSVVQKELGVSFRSRWTELGRAGTASADASPSGKAAGGGPAPLFLTFREVQLVSRVVFGSEADPLYKSFVALVERHLSAPAHSAGSSRGRSNRPGDDRRVEVTALLFLALEVRATWGAAIGSRGTSQVRADHLLSTNPHNSDICMFCCYVYWYNTVPAFAGFSCCCCCCQSLLYMLTRKRCVCAYVYVCSFFDLQFVGVSRNEAGLCRRRIFLCYLGGGVAARGGSRHGVPYAVRGLRRRRWRLCGTPRGSGRCHTRRKRRVRRPPAGGRVLRGPRRRLPRPPTCRIPAALGAHIRAGVDRGHAARGGYFIGTGGRRAHGQAQRRRPRGTLLAPHFSVRPRRLRCDRRLLRGCAGHGRHPGGHRAPRLHAHQLRSEGGGKVGQSSFTLHRHQLLLRTGKAEAKW